MPGLLDDIFRALGAAARTDKFQEVLAGIGGIGPTTAPPRQIAGINISDLPPIVPGQQIRLPRQRPSLAEAQRRGVVNQLLAPSVPRQKPASSRISGRLNPHAVSLNVREFVKGFEAPNGPALEASRDVSGNQNVIGFGSAFIDNQPVKLGTRISAGKAEQLLDADLRRAGRDVDRLVNVPLEENQRNALISLVQDVEPGAFGRSRALAALNAGDTETFLREAFDPDIGFVRGGGRILGGLRRRREAERNLFLRA